jgi:phage-related protein
VKDIQFLGSSLKHVKAFPEGARRKTGFQLRRVQFGLEPDDCKPMKSIGAGVQEIRIWKGEATFRVIDIARLADAVYILHVFEKKTQATAQREIDLARERLKAPMQRRRTP